MRASNDCAVDLVNLLITIPVRVNILRSAGSISDDRGCYEESRANEVELLELAPRLWHRIRRRPGLTSTAVPGTAVFTTHLNEIAWHPSNRVLSHVCWYRCEPNRPGRGIAVRHAASTPLQARGVRRPNRVARLNQITGRRHGSAARQSGLVNTLLTNLLKVDCRICRFETQVTGVEMKKVAQTKWSFWTWLLGGGESSGGGQG